MFYSWIMVCRFCVARNCWFAYDFVLIGLLRCWSLVLFIEYPNPYDQARSLLGQIVVEDVSLLGGWGCKWYGLGWGQLDLVHTEMLGGMREDWKLLMLLMSVDFALLFQILVVTILRWTPATKHTTVDCKGRGCKSKTHIQKQPAHKRGNLWINGWSDIRITGLHGLGKTKGKIQEQSKTEQYTSRKQALSIYPQV